MIPELLEILVYLFYSCEMSCANHCIVYDKRNPNPPPMQSRARTRRPSWRRHPSASGRSTTFTRWRCRSRTTRRTWATVTSVRTQIPNVKRHDKRWESLNAQLKNKGDLTSWSNPVIQSTFPTINQGQCSSVFMSLTLSLFITSFVVVGSWEVALNLEFNSASKINFAHNRSIMVIGAVGSWNI